VAPEEAWVVALTEREKAILRLKAEGTSDYKIALKLRIETPNVTRSRKNALKKLERAKADLNFAAALNNKKLTTNQD
jgi:DNA-binding NarL/FixJ family response regulator